MPLSSSSPITGFMVPAGSPQRLPFLLTFGCGVTNDGTLLISLDSADTNGRMQTSHLQARLTP